MPLFALEQIVLLSFAVRERGCLHAKDRNARGMKTERGRRHDVVPVPLCFFRSVLSLPVMRARSLQLYSNTNNRRWHAVHHIKTRRTADAVIAILVAIARLRQAIRNLHCDDSRVGNKINANTIISRYKNISLHACRHDCKVLFNKCDNNNSVQQRDNWLNTQSFHCII